MQNTLAGHRSLERSSCPVLLGPVIRVGHFCANSRTSQGDGERVVFFFEIIGFVCGPRGPLNGEVTLFDAVADPI